MKRLLLIVICLVIAIPAAVSFSGSKGPAPEGAVNLFDGKTMNGWHKLTSYSGDDGKWEVENGAITGDQYPEGKGGLLVTEKTYSNFDMFVECKADYPIDSGLFLRVQPDVLSYQVTIDYRPGGEVGGIYSPGGGGFLLNFPEGEKLWKKGEYNKMRARITGQPARIQVWLNGAKIVDFQDKKKDDGEFRVPASGHIGIQVHPGGTDTWGKGNKVHFRKIMVLDLDK